MIFKFVTIPEINFFESLKRSTIKIRALNKFDKYMTIFWLMGPFIYLIERDPADLWLTLISISFLIKCCINNDWSWSKQIWFRFALAFWFSSLVSASISPNPEFSLVQGISWIRFPIYAAAAQAWLGKDRDFRILMFISIGCGIFIMSGILISEAIIEPKLRLTWPYGDAIPGVYIAKLGLLVLCCLFFLNIIRFNYLITFFILLATIAVGLTGERTHLLIIICALLTSCLISRVSFSKYLSFFGILVTFSTLLFFSRPETFTRQFIQGFYAINYFLQNERIQFIADNADINLNELNKKQLKVYFSKAMIKDDYNKFISQGLNKKEYAKILTNINLIAQTNIGSYWGAWRGGIQQGLERPILGVGPSGTRLTCSSLKRENFQWLSGKNYCGNHPHNFYVQMFAETGLIGLILGTLMFYNIFIHCLRAKEKDKKCPMSSIAFIIPLALFFPIQQFGSMFGQWGNLFIWFSVGFAISQLYNNRQKEIINNEN